MTINAALSVIHTDWRFLSAEETRCLSVSKGGECYQEAISRITSAGWLGVDGQTVGKHYLELVVCPGHLIVNET